MMKLQQASERWTYSISDLNRASGAMVSTSSATCGVAIATTTKNRYSFFRNSGTTSAAIQKNGSISSQTSSYYPIKVPAGAVSVSISITPSTQYVAGYMFTFADGKYTGMTTTGDSGYTQGTHSRQFSAADDNCYLFITTKYNNAGTSYPTAPTGLDITFS